MTDGNRTQVSFKIDAEVHEQAKAKLDFGQMSEELRQRIEEIAYGAETTERERLKQKLENLRKEKRTKQQEIQQLRQERDEKEREISRVEERLDALMEQDGQYDGFLEAIEVDLHDGQRFDEKHARVKKAAEIGGCSPSDVVEDLQERNPDVPERAFRAASLHEPADWREAEQVDGDTEAAEI